MTNENKHLISGFLAAYFHEDWPEEAKDPNRVVQNYIDDGRKPEQLLLVADAIEEYATQFDLDGDLERALFRELGCYYVPSSDGTTARAWLAHVAKLLREGSATD